MVTTRPRKMGSNAARRTKSLLKSTLVFLPSSSRQGDPASGLLYEAEILGNDVIDGPCREAKGLLDVCIGHPAVGHHMLAYGSISSGVRIVLELVWPQRSVMSISSLTSLMIW